MARHRTMATLGFALLVLLAGCSAGTNLGSQAEPAGSEPAATGLGDAPADSADASFRNGGGGSSEQSLDAVANQQRKRIRTGTVEVTVEDFEEARSAVVAAVRDRGGYVSGSSVRLHREDNRTWRSGRLVLRVPNEEFDATMDEIQGVGTVEAVDTDTEDVTDQLVDLEARLESLRAERERLRELYENASDTEDVLAVQRELSEVQTEIERLEARRRSLEDRVALSTVTVRLSEPEPGESPGGEDNWWEAGLVAAFVDSANAVYVTLRALLVILVYVLPFAVVFGGPLAGGYVVWQRRFDGWTPGWLVGD